MDDILFSRNQRLAIAEIESSLKDYRRVVVPWGAMRNSPEIESRLRDHDFVQSGEVHRARRLVSGKTVSLNTRPPSPTVLQWPFPGSSGPRRTACQWFFDEDYRPVYRHERDCDWPSLSRRAQPCSRPRQSPSSLLDVLINNSGCSNCHSAGVHGPALPFSPHLHDPVGFSPPAPPGVWTHFRGQRT